MKIQMIASVATAAQAFDKGSEYPVSEEIALDLCIAGYALPTDDEAKAAVEGEKSRRAEKAFITDDSVKMKVNVDTSEAAEFIRAATAELEVKSQEISDRKAALAKDRAEFDEFVTEVMADLEAQRAEISAQQGALSETPEPSNDDGKTGSDEKSDPDASKAPEKASTTKPTTKGKDKAQ